jgi:hypothetical protein
MYISVFGAEKCIQNFSQKISTEWIYWELQGMSYLREMGSAQSKNEIGFKHTTG